MPKKNSNVVAKMIQKSQVKLGLTREQFVAQVGVAWSTVNRWENGRGNPSPLAMRRIAELLEKQSLGKGKCQ